MAATHLDLDASATNTAWKEVLFSNTLLAFYGALGVSALIVFAAIVLS